MSAMMLGEISPGGVGSGLYGLLMVALIAVFLGGLMVSRTPQYLTKRIRATEMKMVALYSLATPLPLLAAAGLALALPAGRASTGNPGAHGLSEIVYAFTSAANSNGSAFGGLSGNTAFYNNALALVMLLGRYVPMVFVLGLARSLARPAAGGDHRGLAAHGRPHVRVAGPGRGARPGVSHVPAGAVPRPAGRRPALAGRPSTFITEVLRGRCGPARPALRSV